MTRATGRTVLLIEDNPDSCVIMAAWLEHAGYQVVLAHDGVRGVAAARSILPSVILMDVALPEMDGWTAARTLRDDPATEEIPIIVLSAMALPQDVVRAAAAGVSVYLPKPVSLEQVLESVQRVTA
jgi:CheY-like chemotaxis protein